MTPADDDVPFSLIGGDSFAFLNKHHRGTKNDVENHVTKIFIDAPQQQQSNMI